jgi:hypothetical protein
MSSNVFLLELNKLECFFQDFFQVIPTLRMILQGLSSSHNEFVGFIMRLNGVGLPSSKTVGSLLRTPWPAKPLRLPLCTVLYSGMLLSEKNLLVTNTLAYFTATSVTVNTFLNVS